MKNISKIFMGLVCLLGFATYVNAASNSITANQTSNRYEYISGVPVYYNKASGYNLFVLDNNTYFTSSTNLSNPIEVDGGYSYIINNSSVTGNTYKDYYIAQIAILWYEDYLNGNNANLSASLKEAIKNNSLDTVCYYINKLVNNAINYNDNNVINVKDKEITFTKQGDYYYSNIVEVEVNGLSSKPKVSLYNAPSSATIVNNTVTNNGIGTFQIRIPVNSVDKNYEKDFIVNITGNGYNNTYYKYSYNNTEVIYGRAYSSNYQNLEESIVVKLSAITDTYVRINVIDNNYNYISGIKYNVYSGNCEETTCNSNDLVHTFTTRYSYFDYYNVLKPGYYTLVRQTENANYNLAKKELIYVDNTEMLQSIIINGEYVYNNNNNNNSNNNNNNNNSNNNNNNNNSTTQTNNEVLIISGLEDSTNIIKIYKNDGTLINSFRSDKENFKLDIKIGKYYIKDTKGLIDLEFEMTKKGLKIDDKYTENGKSVIDLSHYLIRKPQNDYIKDEETKEENIYSDENGTIHIENTNGIGSIEIENKVETNTTIEWLSEVVDCPITSLTSTLKYIIGAVILSAGILLVIINVKKQKNNI